MRHVNYALKQHLLSGNTLPKTDEKNEFRARAQEVKNKHTNKQTKPQEI